MIEAAVVDADKGVIARAMAPDAARRSRIRCRRRSRSGRPSTRCGRSQIEAPNGAYFVMQLFVGEPLFLVTGHAVDLKVVDYIKSIELAGSFYSQIEQAMQRSQLIIFLVCGAIASADAAGGGVARRSCSHRA